jgi:hypothetical protein
MPLFKPQPEHMMTEVYSYMFPEVRRELRGRSLEPIFLMNTVTVEDAANNLIPFKLEPKLELPENADGSLNLDELHVPVIERIRQVVGRQIEGLETFEHAYPAHGSSPSIFGLMAEWQAREKLKTVAILEGEYEGYKAYAESLEIPLVTYPTLTGNKPKEGEVWFVSNPSALDGNWHDQEEWNEFVGDGHQIVYDAAYVGLTDPNTINVTAPNIRAVLTSPSKIFGVFRYRDSGVTYTREPVISMIGSKWFKDVPALIDTLCLYERFGNSSLISQYRPVQADICEGISELVQGDVVPSEVLLLGTAVAIGEPAFESHRRACGYRFGLAELFEDYERQNA